jgi:hypothetical protein
VPQVGFALAEIATGPQVKWTLVPESTMQLAEFMCSLGSIKALPSSGRHHFFPQIHALGG